MSQVSIIDIEGNNPQIPTLFTADSGFAIPIANTLEILGDTTAAGVIPVFTTGAGNTITTLVQFSQAIASTDATRVGLAAFDSGDFGVDANGFVTFEGVTDITFDADVGSATSVAGSVNIVGDGATTTSAAGNTITISSPVVVETTYTTDSGSAIPVGDILNVLGGTGINTAGAGDTVTVNLDSPVVVANGGTGRTALTPVNGLLIANSTLPVGITNAGTDGQVVIARTAGAPAFATITSTGSTIDFTLGANTLNMETAGTIATSYETDSGTAIPSAGVLQVTGSHGLNTDGATNVVDIQIDNAITLGDLSAIGAGSPALTCTTGDITITAGNLNMASTTSANVGVVEQNGLRFVHSYPDFRNTFVGVNAGNFTMSGVLNVGVGTNALVACTSATGCTCIGNAAGDSITSGTQVTAIGFGALAAATTNGLSTCCGYQSLGNNTAVANTAFGYQTLFLNITGVQQSAFGHLALTNATGSNNSAYGHISGRFLTTGTDNCFFGNATASNAALTSGSYNIVIGSSSGSSLTTSDSDNIILSNTGTTGDNNTIRIGTQGTGNGQQDSCFVAGIVGVTVSNATPVVINSSTGELGVGANSSMTTWTDVTGTSDTMVAGNGYVANNAGLVTLTLPSSSVIGDTIKVITKGAGFCKIAQNASQTVRFGASVTTTGTGGSLTATAVGDTLEIVSTADDEFYITSSIGTWSVV